MSSDCTRSSFPLAGQSAESQSRPLSVLRAWVVGRWPCLALDVGRALAEGDADGELAGAAGNGERHLGAGRLAQDGGGEIVAAVDGLAIHRGDHVIGAQTSLLGRTLAGGVIHEAGDEHTALHGEAVSGGERRGDVLPLDANEALAGGGDAAMLDELS